MARPLKAARPDALLVAVALASDAPDGPEAITAVIVVPAWDTAAPLASAIWMTGWVPSAAPLAAAVEGAVASSSCFATGGGGGPAATSMAADVTPVNPL